MKLKDELNDFQLLAQNTVQKNPSIYSILNTGIGQFVGEIWKVIAFYNVCCIKFID